MTRGVCFIAFGNRARQQAALAIAALREHSTIDTFLFDDFAPHLPKEFAGLDEGLTDMQKSRWAKVTMDLWTPFNYTLYLDADTRVRGDISAGFENLQDSWDVVMTASKNQHSRLLWHCTEEDKRETIEVACTNEVLQLQAGVFFFRKSPETKAMFEAWREEWLKFKSQDQGALLRALCTAPVNIWLLGRDWNGGALIEHLFGRARG